MSELADERLARIESQLALVLKALHTRRTRAGKRQKTVAARALAGVESDPEQFQPTDIHRAAARRTLNRYRR